jgi:hypothetical protein
MTHLSAFIQTPAMRAAFDAQASGWAAWRASQPESRAIDDLQGTPVLGTAWDYLVRFEVARWSVAHRVPAVMATWIASLGFHNLQCLPALAPVVPLWRRYFDQAQERLGAYIAGADVPVVERAIWALRLALLDGLYRAPAAAAPRFRGKHTPTLAQVTPLVTWMEHWDRLWESLPKPKARILLNPEFNATGRVGGADADLVLDGLLLDLKATKAGFTVEVMRQLAGYAALAELRGFHGAGALQGPVLQVGGVFPRAAPAARIQTVPLRQIFPGGRWARYVAAFAQAASL